MATIVQDSLDSIHEKAFAMGNGDLNCLVYSQGDALMLAVSKNDVWDSRMITRDDPPLPTVDVKNHTWTGTRGAKASWQNYVYPNQVPCSFVRIQSGSVVSARSVPMTGSVAVETAAGTTVVRTLWQSNVFLIRTKGKVVLEEAKQKFLPPVERGESNGITWLKQILPGDDDYAGMQSMTALRQEGDFCAVAVVSSREAEDMLAHAAALIKKTLSSVDASIRQHVAGWRQFWSASGVQLADADFQNWWYRQLYYFRCFSKPGAVAIGLAAGLSKHPGWHGSYKINYNIWQTFWTPFTYNHPELVEPWVEHLYQLLPRARWFAQAGYGCEGAAFFSDTWPHEVDPARCKTRNKHQIAYMPWGYTMGMSGMAIQNLWNYYLYKPDKDYLEARIYPVIKEVAIFYASFIEQCKIDENGKAIVGPSYSPEHGPFGTDDNPYDLAYVRYTFDAAVQAAGILDVDQKLVSRLKKCRGLLPPYPAFNDPEQGNLPVFADWRGGKFKSVAWYNIVVPVIPLFPADQFSWFSSEADRAMCRRSIRYVENRYNRNNSVVILNTARARLSMTDDAIKDTLDWFRKKEHPNGLFHWHGHGNYMSEQTAVGALINEFLLQSVHGTIRIFPAWPKDRDAAFTNLRAQGGFLVSAEQKSGKINRVAISATVSGTLRMLSPWKNISAEKAGKAVPVRPGRDGIITLRLKAGERLVFVEPPASQASGGPFCNRLKPVPEKAKFVDPDFFIWGASMVQDREGGCHLFYSRWPRKLGHNAWVTHSEIAHATSADPLGPYKHVDVALPARGKSFWDGLCTHNPTVHAFEGKYYLYYMGNTGDGKALRGLNWTHRNNQRVGVAVADHPNGPWKRSDVPLIDVSADPKAHDALMASNPSVCRRPDGKYLMVYKAVGKKRKLPWGGPVVHRVATSDSPAGPFVKHPDPVFTAVGDVFPAEDPFVWVEDGLLWAIVKDMKGAFTKSGQSLALFCSADGIDWKPAAHPLVSRLEIRWAAGRTEKVAHLERPQLWLKDGVPRVLFCAADRDREHSFNVHIPLR